MLSSCRIDANKKRCSSFLSANDLSSCCQNVYCLQSKHILQVTIKERKKGRIIEKKGQQKYNIEYEYVVTCTRHTVYQIVPH